jgi:prepilin-type N-terminal cleavage/methylation domain-containing protein
MYTTKKIAVRRYAFTLVEMLVVIAIILALAALAAAFAPRVNDNQKMTRAVDNLEQWLLTAKMRAKRDGLATGLRFIQAPGDAAGTYSQFQYIQQPQPLVGGWLSQANPGNGVAAPTPPFPQGLYVVGGGAILTASVGRVTFVPGSVDFTLGGLPANQWLVQPGDYLEINDGGVYTIGVVGVPSPTNNLVLGIPTPSPYDSALTITNPTTNYRIIRQPRILIGEEPLTLPNNYAVDIRLVPDTIIPNNSTTTKITWSNVFSGSSGFPEILFSPSGAVIGSNAGSGMVFITVYDTTMNLFDINKVGIVGLQTRTGFMGAYGAAAGAGLAGYNPFFLAQTARESGL